jgi:hypothetical protein
MVTNEQWPVGASAPHTPGENMMATYLAERKLSPRYEMFGEGANPDFVACHPTVGEIVFEVYEPEYRLLRNLDGSFSSGSVRSPGEVVRRGLNSNRKRRQAKVALKRGLPFVLVIADTNSEIAFSEHDIPSALFGSLEFTWNDESDMDSDDPGRLFFGAAGRLQRKLNTSFSAVALITAITENDHTHRLDIFHNPFAALPVRRDFAGLYDEQWASIDSGQSYQKTVRGMLRFKEY